MFSRLHSELPRRLLPVILAMSLQLAPAVMCRAQAPTLATASAAFTHSYSPARTTPFGTPVVRATEDGVPSANTPPLSVARDDTEGTLYSRDVNRIRDSADRVSVGAGPRDETWLATAYGVKCIDRKAGVVRHYGRADGLPGTSIVAIVADANGVWCLVGDVDPGEFHLCAFDDAHGRWNERRAIRVAVAPSVTPSALLAIGSRYVAVAHATTPKTSGSFVFLYDRQTGVFSNLPAPDPPPAREDVRLASLNMDGDGLWVGTDDGLLRWNFAEKSWRRFLDGQSVLCVAAADASSRSLLVADRKPSPSQSGDPSNIPEPEWRLTRVDASDNSVHSWTPPRRADVDRFRGGLVPQMMRRGGEADLRQPPAPVALFVAGDGTIWTSHYQRTSSRRPRTPEGTGWTRFDPALMTWTSFETSVVRNGGDAGLFPGEENPRFEIWSDDPNAEYQPVDFAAIPTGAVRPFAFHPARPQPLPGPFGMESATGDPELFWVRRRFPDWLCPDAPVTNATNPDEAPPAPISNLQRKYGPMRDPDDGARVWVVAPGDTAVLRGKPADAAALLRNRRPGGYFSRGSSDLPGAKSDTFDKFPLPGVATVASGANPPVLQTSPYVSGLLPLRGLDSAANRPSPSRSRVPPPPGLIVTTQDEVFTVDTATGTLTPLHLLGRPYGYNSRLALSLAVAPSPTGAAVYYEENYPNESSLARYDTATATFTTLPNTADLPTGSEMGIVAADGGLWIRSPRNDGGGDIAVYLPGYLQNRRRIEGKSDAVVVGPPVQTASQERVWWQLAGATESLCWWMSEGQNGALDHVRGYDARRRRWIAALPELVYHAKDMEFAGTDSSGSVYIVGAEAKAGCIWRYDGALDRWLPVAPAPPLASRKIGSPNATALQTQFVAVTPAAILVIARDSLYRYDRKRLRWDAPVALPAALQRRPSPLDRSVAAVDGAVYVGGWAGLFRLKLSQDSLERLPSAPKWTSLTKGTAITEPRAGIAGNRSEPRLQITDIVPAQDCVYALLYTSEPLGGGSFAGRLNPATGHWELYDETRGFPSKESSRRLIAVGSEAWMVGQSGVYRFDCVHNRWRQVFLTENALSIPGRFVASTAGAVMIGNHPIVASGPNGAAVLVRMPVEQNGKRVGYQPAVVEFPSGNAPFITRLPVIEPNDSEAEALFADADRGLWVTSGDHLYHATRTGWPNLAKTVSLPLPFDPGANLTTSLVAGAEGALWFISPESAFLWKHPRE